MNEPSISYRVMKELCKVPGGLDSFDRCQDIIHQAVSLLEAENAKLRAALEVIAKDRDEGGAEGHYGSLAYEALKSCDEGDKK